MQPKFKKIFAFLLCFLLIFEQSAFAQVAAELNIAGHLASLHSNIFPDKFRPLHLRYLQFDPAQNNFRLLIDKGTLKNPSTTDLENTSKELLKYFFIGLTLPNSAFWVNLRPDSPDNIIDPLLEQTDIGRILLESDLQLKKDTAKATSPDTPEGAQYWDKLYKKAEELFGSENITIPTLTRPWIVPDEIIIRETQDSAYIYKATLKVMLEQDYLKDSAMYSFKDERLKQLNEYSSQLIRQLILPKLIKEVNTSKKYASLRQVYYSLILAQWFKARFLGKGGAYSGLIDRRNLTNLISKESWSKTTYFKEYQKSFKDGEYNLKEPAYTPYGQTIRSYFSGGELLQIPHMPNFGSKITDPKTEGSVVSQPAVSSPIANDHLAGMVVKATNNSEVVSVQAEGKSTVSPAASVSYRRAEAQRLLGRTLTDAEWAVIEAAHQVGAEKGHGYEIGPDGKPRKHSDPDKAYTAEEITQKARTLSGAGFSPDQIDTIIREGIVGEQPTAASALVATRQVVSDLDINRTTSALTTIDAETKQKVRESLELFLKEEVTPGTVERFTIDESYISYATKGRWCYVRFKYGTVRTPYGNSPKGHFDFLIQFINGEITEMLLGVSRLPTSQGVPSNMPKDIYIRLNNQGVEGDVLSLVRRKINELNGKYKFLDLNIGWTTLDREKEYYVSVRDEQHWLKSPAPFLKIYEKLLHSSVAPIFAWLITHPEAKTHELWFSEDLVVMDYFPAGPGAANYYPEDNLILGTFDVDRFVHEFTHRIFHKIIMPHPNIMQALQDFARNNDAKGLEWIISQKDTYPGIADEPDWLLNEWFAYTFSPILDSFIATKGGGIWLSPVQCRLLEKLIELKVLPYWMSPLLLGYKPGKEEYGFHGPEERSYDKLLLQYLISLPAPIKDASPADEQTKRDDDKGSGGGTASSGVVPREAPKTTGGIDFRALPIVTQAINNLSLNASRIPLSRLEGINLNQEWDQIQKMVEAGIMPSSERIKEYMQVSCLKGNSDKDIEKVVSCIADILRSEEERCCSTEPLLEDILVVLESGRSKQELREIFAGNG